MININNPMLIQLLSAKNPKQAMLNIMKGSNNQLVNRAIELINSGNSKDIEQFARNVLSNSGENPDELFNRVQSLLSNRR
jgi:parvulin-like peptidyl-prolyl isomerase